MDVVPTEGSPLFQRIHPTLWQEALRRSLTVSVAKGNTVYDRRQFRRCLGIVLAGQIEVRKGSLQISTLSDGSVFGAGALFHGGENYPTTLTAVTDCRLLLIPQECILWLLRESPEFAEDYVCYLSGRIQFLSTRLDALAAGTAEGKLGHYLLSAAAETDAVTLSATQLSARIGVGRASLYRAFDSLEQIGAIRREGKTIYIVSRQRLEHCI